MELLSTTITSSTKSGTVAQDQLDSFFFVQAGNDDCDRLAFIHAVIIVIVMKFLVLEPDDRRLYCSAAQLKDVKSVYLYPMPGGFDQILASRIVNNHIYKVVSDPKLADAVFTDELSESFLYKLDHIQTPPTPPKTSGSTSGMTPTETAAPHSNFFTRSKRNPFPGNIKSETGNLVGFPKAKRTRVFGPLAQYCEEGGKDAGNIYRGSWRFPTSRLRKNDCWLRKRGCRS